MPRRQNYRYGRRYPVIMDSGKGRVERYRTGINLMKHRRNVFTKSMINYKIQSHYFKRWTSTPGGQGNIGNLATTTDTPFQFAVKLSDLPNSSEFTALYDQYMLTKIVLKFIPVRDNSLMTNTAPTGGPANGYVLAVIDHDDSTALANADEARQYANCKVFALNKPFKIVFVPAILRQMYESSIATAYTPSFKQWVSTTDPAAQHFGVKMLIHSNDGANVAVNTIQFSVNAIYYFKCKNVK